MLKEDADNNITYKGMNWAYIIKNLLCELGLQYIWTQQYTFDYNLQTIKIRILDSYKQSWYSNLNNSNRLSFYSIYKHNFDYEGYLDFISDNKYRISLTKFRLSSHNLIIESGRYDNIPRDERLCKACNMNAIETEYHFLLVCPTYTNLRKQYFKPYFCRWPTIQKFETIMSSENKKYQFNNAKYIFYAMKLREAYY
jgi:hypothetical protein